MVVLGAGSHSEGGHGVELEIREKKITFLVSSVHSREEYVRMLENKKAFKERKRSYFVTKIAVELLLQSEAIAY